jgi:hypothetical protein
MLAMAFILVSVPMNSVFADTLIGTNGDDNLRAQMIQTQYMAMEITISSTEAGG